MTYEEWLKAARVSMASGDWPHALEALEAALAERDSAEALDAMGTALWWIGHVRESLRRRQRAYALYRRAGRHMDAAIIALDISVCYLTNLDNDAAAYGWIARARRAASASEGDELAGWVWLMDGYTAPDTEAQRELQRRALEFARESGDVDLELVALADLGLTLVRSGEVAEGLRSLDESMAGTLGGEYGRLETVVWTSCSMLAACSLVGDLRRAAQWCRAADSFADRYGCPFLQARCRSHYGRVLAATGSWELAETELEKALSMSADCGNGPRLEALAGLAQLRLRQGRTDSAEALLAELESSADGAAIMAEVLIAAGHADRAIAVLAPLVEGKDEREVDYPALAATLAEAHLANDDVEAAVSTARRLELACPDHQHPQAAALSARASGLVARAAGDQVRALRLLRTAIGEFEALDLPFEAARTRLELAQAVSVSDPALSVVEASRALRRLTGLGARHEATKATALLRSLGVSAGPGPRNVGALSEREREVLELVQRGLTNRQIGARLFLSPRTVGHHVSSILTKLGLSTRAEAAAFAAREGTLKQVVPDLAYDVRPPRLP